MNFTGFTGKREKSLREISKSLGIPYASLRELFEKLGLRTRSIKKAQKLKWKQRKERIKNEL